MTFSLIIPVYNVAPYLRECLDSILNQSFADWEALCIDDGSTDGCAAILDEYARRDGRFKVVHQENRGVREARNVGMSLARGEWLYYIDPDDVLLSGALDRMVQLTADDRYDGIILGDPIEFKETPPTDIAGTGRTIAAIDTPISGKALLRCDVPLWGYPILRLLRRDVFGSYRAPKGVQTFEDSLTLIDQLAFMARWLWVDVRLYGYRHRQDSDCRMITVEKVRRLIPLFTQMYNDARVKLGCTEDEGHHLLRQYRFNFDFNIVAIFDSATLAQLREVRSLYLKHVRDVGMHTLSRTVRLRLWIADRLGCKIGFRFLAFLYKLPRVRWRRKFLMLFGICYDT